jgi:hypothetical protein
MYTPFPPKTNIGFVVNNLSASQLGYYLTNNLNKYKNPSICFSVFLENITPHCILPQFSTFNISEAYGFHGILIATSLISADKILTYSCCQDKFFYVWDLEWQRGQNRPTNFYRRLYNSPLKLIARNSYHAKAIENCWNSPVHGCVDDFNISDLVKIVTCISQK